MRENLVARGAAPLRARATAADRRRSARGLAQCVMRPDDRQETGQAQTRDIGQRDAEGGHRSHAVR